MYFVSNLRNTATLVNIVLILWNYEIMDKESMKYIKSSRFQRLLGAVHKLRHPMRGYGGVSQKMTEGGGGGGLSKGARRVSRGYLWVVRMVIW